MKFKVGDIVRGTKNNKYNITDENMYEGKITYIRSDETLSLKILKHKKVSIIGREYIGLDPKYFELVKEKQYIYEDLKKSPIGTKITFEDGTVLVKDDKGCFENNKTYRFDCDFENLKDNSGYCGKIIKIEEPEYKTVYEAKLEILDEVEKRYLRGVIRPFEVRFIKKVDLTNAEYIYIELKSDHISLPNFSSNTMYKGMEIDKKYTLEELGL